MTDFTELKEQMEELAGQWNGDNPGLAEDRANEALDVLEKIKEIEESLEYLQTL